MTLSSITNHGMRMTSMCTDDDSSLLYVNVFYNIFILELVPHILKIQGVSCFLSEKLCQDPLESLWLSASVWKN